MHRNVSKILRKANTLLPSLTRKSILAKVTVNNKKFFATSKEIYRPGPTTLSYWVFQPDIPVVSKIPVIILHGLLGSKQNWRGLSKAIAVKLQRKVYALDARNHGDSPHEDLFDYSLMTEDLKHFMSSQSISEAVIVGHSMGGRTAMHLALTNENLVNKLVVVDVSPMQLPHDSDIVLNYMKTMIDALKSIPEMTIVQARKEIDTTLSKTIPEESVRNFLLTNLAEKNKNLYWKANLEVLLKTFNPANMKFSSISGNCMKDTLFIAGEKSPYIKPEDHPQIKVLFPKAEFVTVPGAGHWVHSQKPAEFLEILHSFI